LNILIKGILFLTIIVVTIWISNHPISNPRCLWDKYLSSEFKNIPKPANGPDAAAIQNYYMTIDPALKAVPSERLFKAFQKTKELDLQNQRDNKSPGLEWVETGSNMGGRTRAIMKDPNDPYENKYWAGSITGGLWYNYNIFSDTSGWQAVNDFWPSLSISCLVSDPNNPMLLYAGTGEYQTARTIYRASSGVGIGIWKSFDGGDTWGIIPSTENFRYISDLKIRVEDGVSIIYAGVVSGLYQGTNFVSEPTDGLYRSVNGGQNWE